MCVRAVMWSWAGDVAYTVLFLFSAKTLFFFY